MLIVFTFSTSVEHVHGGCVFVFMVCLDACSSPELADKLVIVESLAQP